MRGKDDDGKGMIVDDDGMKWCEVVV